MESLEEWIAQGEGVQQDFKLKIESQQKIARTIAAFANTEGGRLLIGVKDNGRIVGVEPSEEYYMMSSAAETFVSPSIDVKPEIFQHGHKLVLIVDVPKSDAFHKAKNDSGQWRYYIRINDVTYEAPKIVFDAMRLKQSQEARPEVLDHNTMCILDLLKEGGMTYSQLVKRSMLKRPVVERILSLFIAWDIVRFELRGDQLHYFLIELA